MPLTNYRTLGRSGLVVSPLALGTMTFGTARWGLDEAGSSAVFNAYVEAGGNFVDTADVYSGGRSEEMLGVFLAERKLRDQIVVATKAGFAVGRGVHAGGNGAKHIRVALEGLLGYVERACLVCGQDRNVGRSARRCRSYRAAVFLFAGEPRYRG